MITILQKYKHKKLHNHAYMHKVGHPKVTALTLTLLFLFNPQAHSNHPGPYTHKHT